jgi:hypothetical protein
MLPFVAGACERYTPVELAGPDDRLPAGGDAVHWPVADLAPAAKPVLADLIRGSVSYELAPHVVRMPLENNTLADTYLTPQIDELTGRYSATWTSSRAFLLHLDGESDCLAEQTCSLVEPPEPRLDPVIPDAIPASFLTLRVIRQETDLTTACVGCDPGEFALPANGRYHLEAVVADAGFVSPPEVDRTRIARILVGAPGNSVPLTGVDDGTYV